MGTVILFSKCILYSFNIQSVIPHIKAHDYAKYWVVFRHTCLQHNLVVLSNVTLVIVNNYCMPQLQMLMTLTLQTLF